MLFQLCGIYLLMQLLNVNTQVREDCVPQHSVTVYFIVFDCDEVWRRKLKMYPNWCYSLCCHVVLLKFVLDLTWHRKKKSKNALDSFLDRFLRKVKSFFFFFFFWRPWCVHTAAWLLHLPRVDRGISALECFVLSTKNAKSASLIGCDNSCIRFPPSETEKKKKD